MKDKFKAVWVSHSTINDFIRCPRAYFLKNIYKNPKTGKKIELMSPPLALGKSVHEVVEALSVLPVDERLSESLLVKFDEAWKKVSGKLGGFKDEEEEKAYKKRGKRMIQKVIDDPGPILNKAIKIKMDLPYYWLSEKENIILCGKVDWLEYLPKDDIIHVIDFKTGKKEERMGSLQLPIYYLLVNACQKRPVGKMSYWYLDQDVGMKEFDLPDSKQAYEDVLRIAREIKLARQAQSFKCPKDGCSACEPYEAIIRGEVELIGLGEYGREVYI